VEKIEKIYIHAKKLNAVPTKKSIGKKKFYAIELNFFFFS